MFGNTGGMGGMGAGQEAILRELMRGGQGQMGPINGSVQAPTAQMVQAPQQQGGDLSSVVGKLGNTAAGAYLMNKGKGMETAAKSALDQSTGSVGNATADQNAFNDLTQNIVDRKTPQDMLQQADMLKYMGMGFLR